MERTLWQRVEGGGGHELSNNSKRLCLESAVGVNMCTGETGGWDSISCTMVKSKKSSKIHMKIQALVWISKTRFVDGKKRNVRIRMIKNFVVNMNLSPPNFSSN
jgi:hypothetical protein